MVAGLKVLSLLADRGPLTAAAIAEAHGWPTQRAGNAIGHLIRSDLVEGAQGKPWRITPLGRDYLKAHAALESAPPPLCACGCGQAVGRVLASNAKRGMVAGEWREYVTGHNNPNPTPLLDLDMDRPDGCWIWQGPTTHGYGFLTMHGFRRQAHRWMYEELVGPVSDDLDLHHTCHNRLCVNPAHLEPLSHSEHMRRHTKLTWGAVAEIRESTESLAALALRFGVCPDTVRRVRRGHIWRVEEAA